MNTVYRLTESRRVQRQALWGRRLPGPPIAGSAPDSLRTSAFVDSDTDVMVPHRAIWWTEASLVAVARTCRHRVAARRLTARGEATVRPHSASVTLCIQSSIGTRNIITTVLCRIVYHNTQLMRPLRMNVRCCFHVR